LLIYISTDYVFPGRQGEAPYGANATPAPTNIYGETKLDGEKAVLATSQNAVVLRVPVLYGVTDPEDNNKESAVNILMDSLQKAQKETVKMDDYAIRYPTNTEDVARVCADIAKYYAASSTKELPKVLQFSSEDRMTKYEISQKFAEIMGLPLDNMVADAESGKKPAADGTLRPYDCHLDTAELKKLGIDVSTMDFVAWWRRKLGAFRR
jgi:S-adenosylmethionine synthetase